MEAKQREGFGTEEIVVNMGPQHPSTHGVLRILLTLDGEKVTDCEVVIGYLHRGVEKLAEHRDYKQAIILTDRLDYLASMSNNLAYVLAVEKLMDVKVPERAEYIRVIVAELQRIASHLIWLATHAMDIGAITVFLYCFREREEILNLFEMLCGARLTYNYMRIGGVSEDLPEGFIERANKFIEIFPDRIDEYETLLTKNRIWIDRTVGVGVISGEDGIDLGLSGPSIRGSGVRWDVRKAEPYSIYDRFDFQIPIGEKGDTYDRYLVRIEEMRQSNKIVKQALDQLPDGEIMAKVPRIIKPPKGEVYRSIESPKGELGFYIVSDGTSTSPYRMKIRPPSFVNMESFSKMIKGHLVADVIAVIGTLDIVLGEVDR
ncbi:MAG: NADH dehydrogenase [Candidatus Schekmanbacteria bacterium RIFCSPLOWO2_12_FULL_38_15]|uniref:NADH-quinone oxidoreductase subunit D n=1 Tax=Candidatus Schekmanbacteria bacterium RIFCSPLOWO2_12_FULL_38_15 TaxID=1817883 RepID=A0A1F7SI09_9BACT|nr:MAG: NADH dehydrogenase [Candidatus Schekmanbacteria bacterium RIFCSPLOWO2_12_FULL_38_15]